MSTSVFTLQRSFLPRFLCLHKGAFSRSRRHFSASRRAFPSFEKDVAQKFFWGLCPHIPSTLHRLCISHLTNMSPPLTRTLSLWFEVEKFVTRWKTDLNIFPALTLFGRAFSQPKKTRGGHFGPRHNMAISSQMTMKLGEDILWVEIFTNGKKFLMTSLSC